MSIDVVVGGVVQKSVGRDKEKKLEKGQLDDLSP